MMQISNVETNAIEKWVGRLITGFREEASKLSEEEQRKIGNLDDLSAPCQVDVVWLSNPAYQFDEQLLIFTHFADEADLAIRLWGPIPPWKVVESFEQIVADPKWDRELPKDTHYLITEAERKYKVLLEGFLVQTFERFKNRAMQQALTETVLAAGKYGAQFLSREAFVWFISGNVTQLNPEEIVSRILKDAEARAARIVQPEPPKPTRIKAYGTFFYPPIWIGQLPVQTMKDKLAGARQPIFQFSRKAVDTEYKGHKVVINHDGFIVIAEEDKGKALELLNEIVVSALLPGVPSYTIRESEIGEAQIDPNTLEIRGSTMPLVSMRTGLVDEQWQTVPSLMPLKRKVLDPSTVTEFVRRAETLTSDVRTKNVLKCLLEAWTHLQNSEHPQCIVMGWVVIETMVENLWQTFLRQKQITGKRKDKLSDSARWYIDTVIEALSLAGQISDEIYNAALKVKRKRNAIVHDGESATESEAKECMDLALKLLQNQES